MNAPPNKGWRRLLSFLLGASTKPAQPNWYDAVVLASSFGEVWDLEHAWQYWQTAMTLCNNQAKVGPMGQVLTHRLNGGFYYDRNDEGDLEKARKAFDAAFNTLNPKVNGHDVTYYQNYMTRFQQATALDQLQYTEQAAEYLRAAWECSGHVRTFWRRLQARDDMARFVAFGGDPERFELYGGLPQEMEDEVRELQAQQQMPVADAQRQGSAAAQQWTLAAQQRAMPRLRPDLPKRSVRALTAGPATDREQCPSSG